MSTNSLDPQLICPNCEHVNESDALFCSQCSQKRKLNILSVWMMMSEFFANFINYDSKTFSTIRGLFVPGYLTNEYIANRRVSYLAPIRLFIFLMFAFFAVLSFQDLNAINFNGNSSNHSDKDESSSEAVESTNNQYFNLLEQGFPTLRYKVLMDRVNIELQKQLENKKSRLENLEIKRKDIVDDSKKKAALEKKITGIEAEIIQLESSINSLNDVKKGIKFNEKGTFDVKLFYDKVYKFKLSDVNSLSTEQIINKYHVQSWLEKIVIRQMLKLNKDSKAFAQFIFQNLTWAIILEMLIMALFFKLFYLRSKRKYVEYFIFHLNVRSWLFLIAIILMLIPYEFTGWLIFLVNLSIAAYLYMSLKKVYKQSILITSVKFIILTFIDFMVLIFSLTLVVMIVSLFY